MGEVYRALDTTLGRDVALKVLTPGVTADAARLTRFEREARSLAALNHPNIGAIYGLADGGTARALVLELVEGDTLARRLAAGPLPVRDALRIGVQIASALSAAHCKGIVHRDLKPANIVVTADGAVKVLDFGLAKAVGDADGATIAAAPALTQPGAIVGTPRYMSPEQARGRQADARSDLWALGCILFESITGRAAFRGDTSVDVLSAVLNATPDYSALPADTPSDVATLIRRCLDKDPDKRPTTAGAAYAALEYALHPGQPSPPVARHRKRLGVAFGAAAAVAVAAIWMLWPERRAGSGPPIAPIRSIVVRPLQNSSHDASQDYFAEGMTEALTTQLAKAGGLRVVSTTSAARMADKPVAEIATTLKVDAIVEGAVLVANDRVRVTARLIHAASDSMLWADSYERSVGDVLLLQDDVARAVAQRIRGAASAPSSAPTEDRAAPVNPEAYREYLLGRHQWNRRTKDSVLEAISHFERAVELQPDYAAAHAGSAESWVVLSAHHIGAMSPRESLPRARAEALRALQLDGTQAGAHAVLARERQQAWDWKAAESEADRAVALEPNNAEWHFWRASLLAALGRHTESIAEARQGSDLDPVSPIVGAGVSWMYQLSRRFDDALTQARHVLGYEPSFAIAHARVGEAMIALSRPEAAVASFRRAYESSGESPDMLALLGYASARAGKRADALATLNTLQEWRRSRYVSEYDIALVHTGLGDKVRALEWLERAYEGHEWAVAFVNVEPLLDILRDEPAFQDIVRRIGLDPASGKIKN
jgi:TolB-like protein/tetratricopeptide (TPR) repeat protein